MTATPDSYTACRVLGHAWFPVDAEGAWAQGWGTIGQPIALRCDRCTTERREIIDSSGELVRNTRRYLYPTNYRYPPRERPLLQDMRLALIAIIRQNRRDDLARARAAKKAANGG